MTKTRSTSMNRFSRLLACSILLLAPPLLAQIPETVNPGTVMPDDSVELEYQIGRAKFDQILPRVMRETGIEMWIHVVRPWTPDPLSFELGGNAYLLREGETEAPPEIEKVWRAAAETR